MVRSSSSDSSRRGVQRECFLQRSRLWVMVSQLRWGMAVEQEIGYGGVSG